MTAGPLYVSGPMSGLPDFNYPAFHDAAARLRAAGFTVENPAENPPPCPSPTWADWMRVALLQMLRCHGVALLPGWRRSRGARIERLVALVLGMRVVAVEEWLKEGGAA